MKVWWCQEHEAAGNESICNVSDVQYLLAQKPDPCRMVPMRLIPDNAETVDREAVIAALKLVEKKALRYPGPWLTTWYAARAYLAALDGETP